MISQTNIVKQRGPWRRGAFIYGIHKISEQALQFGNTTQLDQPRELQS